MGKRLCQRVSHGEVNDKFLHHLMFSSLQPVSKTLIDSFIGGLFFKKTPIKSFRVLYRAGL